MFEIIKNNNNELLKELGDNASARITEGNRKVLKISTKIMEIISIV